VGYFSDARQAAGTHSFDTILIIAGLVPFIGKILVCCWCVTRKRRIKGWCGESDVLDTPEAVEETK
jgi:hypothetical protein